MCYNNKIIKWWSHCYRSDYLCAITIRRLACVNCHWSGICVSKGYQSITAKCFQWNSLCNRLWSYKTTVQLRMFSSELQFSFQPQSFSTLTNLQYIVIKSQKLVLVVWPKQAINFKISTYSILNYFCMYVQLSTCKWWNLQNVCDRERSATCVKMIM